MHIHKYTYKCMYIHIFVHIHVYVYIYIHIYTYTLKKTPKNPLQNLHKNSNKFWIGKRFESGAL